MAYCSPCKQDNTKTGSTEIETRQASVLESSDSSHLRIVLDCYIQWLDRFQVQIHIQLGGLKSPVVLCLGLFHRLHRHTTVLPCESQLQF